MDSVNSPPTAARRRPFQFSMATLFVVTTGLAVLLSLAVSLGCLGLPLGILVVAPCWSALAVRSGWRRLAYYLAAIVIGACLPSFCAVVGILVWFVHPSAGFIAWPPRAVAAVCGFVFATVLAAGLLRRWIRRPGPPIPWGTSLGFCTITLLLPCIAAAVFIECYHPWPLRTADFEELMRESLEALVYALVTVTVSLPFSWPIACIGVRALRRIDPVLGDLGPEQLAVLRAIVELPGTGVEPLTTERIAAHLGYDLDVTQSLVWALWTFGLIRWGLARGYYVSHPYWLQRELDRLALPESRPPE